MSEHVVAGRGPKQIDVNISGGNTGGTQYTEGTTQATPVGNVVLWKDTGNILRAIAQGEPLPVRLFVGGGVAVPDSGGNILVNVQNFAIGQFGNSDAMASNLTSGLTFAENFLFNGTTWDRWRGDTTNGAFVNVKAIAALTTVGNGKTTVTTAGTRVVLGSSTAISSVTIKALSTNTGLIYVGNSSVSSSNGFQLSAKEAVSLDVNNLNDIYIDSSVNGEGVTYIYAV